MKRNDKMNAYIMTINEEIYEIGKRIGLNEEDINVILNDSLQKIEKSSFEYGPKPYWASFYGSISIINFK